jgi:hypothetical protein
MRWTGWLWSFGVVAQAALSAQSPAQTPDTSQRAVVAKAVGYLKDYKEKIQFVIADEATRQTVFNRLGREVGSRDTSGEYFLTYLAAEGGWIGVRDIAVVDGKPVERRDNLRELLTQASFARIGRQLVESNARYNIGPILRTFNDPMMSLLVLDDRHRSRFRFERERVQRDATGTRVTIAFVERERPTLVQSGDGRQIFSRGEFDIDAAGGRIVRASITMKDGATTATMTTWFADNPKLGLWVPETMTEEYVHSTNRVADRVTARSSYTNYRRFNVNVVIK